MDELLVVSNAVSHEVKEITDAGAKKDENVIIASKKDESLECLLRGLIASVQIIDDRQDTFVRTINSIDSKIRALECKFQARLGEPGSSWPKTGIEARLLKIEEEIRGHPTGIEARLGKMDTLVHGFQNRLGEPNSHWPSTGIETRLLKLEQQLMNVMHIPDAPQHNRLGERLRTLEVLETRVHVLEAGPVEPLPVDPPEYRPRD